MVAHNASVQQYTPKAPSHLTVPTFRAAPGPQIVVGYLEEVTAPLTRGTSEKKRKKGWEMPNSKR